MIDSEDMGLCNCKVSKTRSYIRENHNVCPTCKKSLIIENEYSSIDEIKDDEQIFDEDEDTLRQKMEEIGIRQSLPNSDIPMEDVLKLAQAGIFGSTKNRSHDSGVRLNLQRSMERWIQKQKFPVFI